MAKKALVVAALSGFFLFLEEDIKILQDLGYEVICAGNMVPPVTEENMSLFNEYGVKFVNITFSSNSMLSPDNLKAYMQVRKLLKKEQFSLIHCHTPFPGLIVRVTAEKYRMFNKCKVIYTTHGFYFHRGSSKKTWFVFHTVEKLLSAFSDAIITINNEDYENAKRMFCKHVYKINGMGLDYQKYQNVQIDRNAYRRELGVEDNELMVLAIGELSKRKNHKVIIDAIKKSGLSNVCFAICGKAIAGAGTYDELLKYAKKCNVKLLFLGHRHDIPQICYCADIGTISSTREGLGMSGLEMLASGLPLLASKVHGINDYAIEGITAFKADPYDSDGFAKGLNILADKKTRDSMKKACRDMAKKFDIGISAKQKRTIYEDILK